MEQEFTTRPGGCFRIVNSATGYEPCPNRVVSTGTFTDAEGTAWTVDSCADHRTELTLVLPEFLRRED